MNSHKWMQAVAMLVTMVIVLLNFCGITLAGNEEVSAGNTVGESSQIPLEGSGDEASMSSRDIQYGSPIPCRLTRAVTPMYAPYDSGSAPFTDCYGFISIKSKVGSC